MGIGLIDKTLNLISDFNKGVSEVTNGLPQSYCVLETVDTDNTLVSKNGSLVSVIELGGSISMIGNHEYADIISSFSAALSPFMKGGHKFQIVFDYDPEQAKREIDRSLLPTLNTSKILNLDLNGFIDDWSSSLSEYCAYEKCYIVMWTNFDALSNASARAEKRSMLKSDSAVYNAKDAQKAGYTPEALHEAHSGYLASVKTVLGDLELIHELYDNHQTLLAIRKMILPSLTSDNWRARLPGDPIPLRESEPLTSKDDFSSYAYPEIGEQLYPDDIEDEKGLLFVDNRYHAPLMMSLAPQSPRPFNVLFRTLISKPNLPFRISIMMDEADGLGLKSFFSAVLSFAGSNNKKINKAIEDMEANDQNGGTNVRFKFVASTWAEEAKQAINNRSELAGTIQAWGGCDVELVSGDPLLPFSASLPAYMSSSPASGSVPPIEQALNLMPLTRNASAWKEGSFPFRTPDGKLMPYLQMSSLQNAWIDIGVAPMGYGKSVLLNTLNLSFCLQPGLSQLPYLSIVDIGPSSKGLVNLLKASLSEQDKYLVAYHRLRMEKEYAINPFDLPVCTFEPTPSHISFLVNFVNLLCTPLGESSPPDGVSGLARASIKAAYKEFHPKNNPKKWRKGIDTEVDKYVDALALHTHDLTWHAIADALFDTGEYHMASRAQRYAVPLLSDVASISRQAVISSIYKGEAGNGEKITDYFWRSCIDAISAYPILAVPTAFDIGESKVVSLDLEEVAPKGGPEADRQSGLMFMLARHVVGSRFFRMPADVSAIDEKYKSFHLKEITRIREQPKRLAYDEFHRVSRNTSVSAQIVSDIETASRESRKWRLGIGLYSQGIDDYPDILIDLATSVFVMGVGNAKGAAKIANLLGLNDSLKTAIERLRKPNKSGATMMAYFKTSKGNMAQLLTNTLGPQGMWAFSTTTEDAGIRDYLYEMIGVTKTLSLLGSRYPGGVKSLMEGISKSRAMSGEEPINGYSGWVKELDLLN
jgi:intracellular multiplication protein IcmB